jgi:tRNA threonylcarbamoyladenosine biosynthesis protein TsaE
MKKILNSMADMESFVSAFIRYIYEDKKERTTATVIGLRGDLGAGKTTFTKTVAATLGVDCAVTSPTFVIEKIYKLPSGGRFSRLIHIDAYRLESGNELVSLGWEKISNDSQNLIFIEWPENVADLLLEDTKIIDFKFIDENTREVKM